MIAKTERCSFNSSSILLPSAIRTANFEIDESENLKNRQKLWINEKQYCNLSKSLGDIRQTQQHQGNPDRRIGHRRSPSQRSLWANVPVT
jgi:hypothetical protein